jgi:hypothetical protein
MRRGRAAKDYLDGFDTVRSILELDQLAIGEVLGSLRVDDGDPSLAPWKRGFHTAVRSAVGR